MARSRLDIQYNYHVDLPNGRSTKITLIKHPGAVLIVPFLNNDTVVMIRQFRPALGKYIYELPAGTLDSQEPLLSCARRELLEETGLKSKKFTKMGSIYPVPGYSTEIIHIFKAEDLTMTQAQPEEYEVIEILSMSRPKVRQLLGQGKLMDAKTICALAFCKWL